MNPITWSEENENFLIIIGEKCKAYKDAHNRKARLYWWLNVIFTIISIAIGSITGSSMFVFLAVDLDSNSLTWKEAITGSIIILASIFTGIKVFLRLGEKSSNSKNASNNFIKLRVKINKELSFPKEKRIEPRRFLDMIENEFNQLISESPNVNEKIVKNIDKATSKIDIVVEDQSVDKDLMSNISNALKDL